MLCHCTATAFPAVSPNYCDFNIMLTLSLFFSHFLYDSSVRNLRVWNHFGWSITWFMISLQLIATETMYLFVKQLKVEMSIC